MPERTERFVAFMGLDADKADEAGNILLTEFSGLEVIPLSDDGAQGGAVTSPGWKIASSRSAAFFPGGDREAGGEPDLDGDAADHATDSAFYNKDMLFTMLIPDVKGTVIGVVYCGGGVDGDVRRRLGDGGDFRSLYVEEWGDRPRFGMDLVILEGPGYE